jgi:lipoprotein Spr
VPEDIQDLQIKKIKKLKTDKLNIIYIFFILVIFLPFLNSCFIFKRGGKKEPEVFSGGVFTMPAKDTTAIVTSHKKATTLQQKFGKQLSVPPDSIKNYRLYGFINNWLGIPYQWGGMNENGIDCSAFVQK